MDNKQKSILVAVNDLFFYTKIRDALRLSGHSLERARVQEDVSRKAGDQPAAFVVNMNDENLDAFKAIEALKSDDRSKSIPILAFANHDEVETWKRAKVLGVTKIVSRNEFSSRTKDLIDEVIGTRHSPMTEPTGASRQQP